MLKIMIYIENNIDIAKYAKLRNFLKTKHTGYRPKKAKVLSTDEIKKFITEAPDKVYLSSKVRIFLVSIMNI